MTIKKVAFLSAAILILSPERNIRAQVKEMTVIADEDDETKQFLEDVFKRRVLMSPNHTIVEKTLKSITIELHNPTKDTLKMIFYLSDTLVGLSRFVHKDSSSESPKGKAGGLLKDDPSDSVSSIPKPMSGWIKDVPNGVTLLPGEKKVISLNIDIPMSLAAGEYITWIVAEVLPRKMVPLVKRAVYTTSITKLSYKTENNTP